MNKTIVMQTKLCKMENQIADLERDIYNIQCKIDENTVVNQKGLAELTEQSLINKLDLKIKKLEQVHTKYAELCNQNFYYRSGINAEQQEMARNIVKEQKRLKSEKRLGIFTESSHLLTIEANLLFSILGERFPNGWDTTDYIGVTKTVSWAIKEARRELAMEKLAQVDINAPVVNTPKAPVKR